MTDDLISRQAVLDMAHAYGNGLEPEGFCVEVEDIQSLPSAQPKQTDCEYCHEDSEGYSRPIEKNSRAWLIRRGRTMKLRIVFKGGWSECDILYCPMCGRRLADG